MDFSVTFIKNLNTQFYDVVVTDSATTVVYETICSCKTSENAEWIVNLILREGYKNE